MKYKILYIDDEIMNLFLFENLLEDEFDIITNESPFEALELLQSNKSFDLIISDMKMPKMSGLEFVKRAKRIFPDCAYALLSGYNENDDIENSIKEGIIEAYLHKPFDTKIITNIIKKVIEK